MSTRLSRGASKDLARMQVVLSPGRAGRGWILWCALVIAAMLAGAAGDHFYWNEWFGQLQQPVQQPVQQPAGAPKDPQQPQQPEQAQEQSRLLLRVSEARSQELERQIDALNQGLRECQEEVTFFRKARDGKH
jgi:uncharacterized protein HemX